MQPSSSSGRKVRLALLPFSWLIAFATVAGVLKIVASIRASTVTELLKTETLWPLAIVLPALMFGKALGLIGMNLLAYFTPLRAVFERECKDTGRHDFATATTGLFRVALVLSMLTVAGVTIFLLFSR